VARRIGEVFVSVEADTSLFRTSAVTGIKKSLIGVSGNIPIRADTAEARTQIEALKRRMTDLNAKLTDVKIRADGRPAESTVRKLQLRLKELADTVASISMETDTTKLDLAIKKEEANLAKLNAQASHLTLDADEKKLASKISAMEADLAKLYEQAGHLTLDADEKRMRSKLADMERQAFHLRAALGDPDGIELNVDKAAAEAKLASLDADILVLEEHMSGLVMDANDKALLSKIYAAEAELRALRELGDIPLIADAVALDAAIANSIAKLEALRAEAADLKIGGKSDLAALAAAEGALLGLEDAAKKLDPELKAVNGKLVTGARNFGRFGLGVLTARVALFGGLSAVSGWHIALDTVIESLAVIIPALVTAAAGLLAFGVAGSDAARAVYNRLLNIHTVSDALDKTIPPMTGHLEDLHDVVRPKVWQLYGDAIAIAHDKTGLFNQLAVKTGDVVDTLAARLTVLATTSGTGLNKFLESGGRDLKEFGRIFTSLGDAFGKLIQVTERTHIAEVLLNIVGAAAKMFDMFTKLPIPILALVIGLHGIYLWSGLAATALTALLRPFGRMAASAAGAKLAGTAVKDLAAAGSSTRFQRLGAAFKDLGSNIAVLPGRVKGLASTFLNFVKGNWPSILIGVGVAALITLGIWLSRTKSRAQEMISEIDQIGKSATVFTVINVTAAQLVKTNSDLAGSQKDLNTQLRQGSFLAPAMSARFGPLGTGAQEAADRVSSLTQKHDELVGTLVTVGGHLAQVSGLFGTDGLAGAEALASVAGVKLSALESKNATVWAAAVQQIAGVVQGYAAMGVGATSVGNAINVLTISQSDQLKNMQTLNSAFDEFTKIVSGPISGFLTFANTLKRFGADAGKTGAQMTGLGSGFDTVSKKMTDASLQLQSDFQDTFNAATQMADAMRLTGVASDKQVSSIKDVVQVMIPMAGSNKAAAAEISALAQEAGGPATTNLKTLAKWAGHTVDPLGKSQKAAQDAAISFFNMSEDAKKLGNTLAQDLTKDMATAAENAVGLQGAMNEFDKDVIKGATDTAKGHKDRKTLLDDLKILNITGPQASAVLKAMTGSVDLNGREALATHKARQSINDDIAVIMKRGPVAKQDLMDMTKAIVEHGIKSDAEKSARKKLIDDLVNTGLSSKTATALVDGLIKKLQNVPKKVATDIEVHAGGTGSIVITGKGTAAGQGNIRFTAQAAEGLYVTQGTTPTADDVIARVSKGELIVPTNMVKAGAVDHLRGMIPGFKTGGFVGLDNRIGSAPGAVAGVEAKLAAKAILSGVTEAVAAARAAVAAAAGSGGGSIAAYARSFLGKIPYQFGGTTLQGMDCSGFTGMVYRHAGFKSIPRTSEAQGMWAQKSDKPQEGGLAFYHSPAGGPDPGHVAIIDKGGGQVISQGGGMGPKLMRLRGMPLLWTGVPPGGFPQAKLTGGKTSGSAQAWMHSHLPDYGWGENQWGSLQGLWTGESGWRWNARNPSSGAYGIPQALPASKMAAAGADWLTNPVTQMRWGSSYIRSVYGNPNTAYTRWLSRSPHWYSRGGLVPGYATGGQIAREGRAYLTAWKTRHGGGWGSAWGPVVLNQQIEAMAAAQHKASVLSHATGLNAGQHRHYSSVAADEAKRLKVLKHELSVERSWRTNLTASDKTLQSYINAAGTKPSLAKNVRAWHAQINQQKATIGNISKMLGWSKAHIAADVAAGRLGPGGTPLPKVTHTSGGDVTDSIGALLHSVISPFARGGMIKSFDKGGVLSPGLTMAYNGTGRNEQVGAQPVHVHFEIGSSGNTEFDAFMLRWIRRNVHVKGAGDVQRAFGEHGKGN
jgi:cell wall-associated NlpC family hydrolase/predicted  nucleic acid-binding Zn-ribbon protein